MLCDDGGKRREWFDKIFEFTKFGGQDNPPNQFGIAFSSENCINTRHDILRKDQWLILIFFAQGKHEIVRKLFENFLCETALDFQHTAEMMIHIGNSQIGLISQCLKL